MKVITKNTDYAIRALLHLARNKRNFISTRMISQQEGIPLAFLRRILQELVNRGFVISKEGVDGGVKLKTAPKDIYFSDLLKIFQGNIELLDCMFRKDICSKRSHCVLRKKIKTIEDKLISEFRKLSIAGLLKESVSSKGEKKR